MADVSGDLIAGLVGDVPRDTYHPPVAPFGTDLLEFQIPIPAPEVDVPDPGSGLGRSGDHRYPPGVAPKGEHPFHRPIPENRPPAGAYLDLGSKTELRHADGTDAEMHPADEGTMLSFMVRKGTLRGNARVGNTFHEIPGHLVGVALENEVSRRIDDAYPWSRLVENGDVELVRFVVHRPKHGETNIVVQYKNLRLDPTRVREARNA